jgi:hypothetical protein
MERRPLSDPEIVLETAEVQAQGDVLLEKAKDFSRQVEEKVNAVLTAGHDAGDPDRP